MNVVVNDNYFTDAQNVYKLSYLSGVMKTVYRNHHPVCMRAFWIMYWSYSVNPIRGKYVHENKLINEFIMTMVSQISI